MKKTKIVLSIWISLFLYSNQVLPQNTENENKEIFLYTKENILSILNKIPANQEKLYGFSNRAEFEIASVGNAIQLYTINDSIINKHPIWRVPILVNGEYRALATIQKEDDNYTIGDFGATVLANDIQQKMKENPNEVILGILRIYSISSDFLIAKQYNSEKVYIPLTSAEIYLASKGMKNGSFYTLNELKNLLKTHNE